MPSRSKRSTATELSAADARRIALLAQGFGKPRPARASAAAVLACVRALGLLQLDPINVLLPAHYLPVWSRLGRYDRDGLDALVHGKRALAEHWAHVASIVPVEHFHLMRGRNEDDGRSWTLYRFMREHEAYAATVLEEVRRRGPVAADELTEPARKKESWSWSDAKRALEGHLALGAIAIAGRRKGDRARLYDLAERVIGEHHRPRLGVEDARRELLRMSARALGIATVRDLVDYYRLPPGAKPLVAQMAADGELTPVRVAGWRDPAYLAPGAPRPRAVHARTLLSPFDPLIWFRPRALRLFGLDYRIEIYTPAAKRKFGYYCLPFLDGEAITALVDLKADRATGRLLVQAAHRVGTADPDALAAELRALADWLGLGEIRVAKKGDLARTLTSSVARTRRPSPPAAGRRAAPRRARA
jgi:uncharacterized protein YcaQ